MHFIWLNITYLWPIQIDVCIQGTLVFKWCLLLFNKDTYLSFVLLMDSSWEDFKIFNNRGWIKTEQSKQNRMHSNKCHLKRNKKKTVIPMQISQMETMQAASFTFLMNMYLHENVLTFFKKKYTSQCNCQIVEYVHDYFN